MGAKKDKKAIKKKYSEVADKLKMLQITNGAIQEGIINLMHGKEEFTDTNASIDDLIYSGDVFQTILYELHRDKVDKSKKTDLLVVNYGLRSTLINCCHFNG